MPPSPPSPSARSAAQLSVALGMVLACLNTHQLLSSCARVSKVSLLALSRVAARAHRVGGAPLRRLREARRPTLARTTGWAAFFRFAFFLSDCLACGPIWPRTTRSRACSHLGAHDARVQMWNLAVHRCLSMRRRWDPSRWVGDPAHHVGLLMEHGFAAQVVSLKLGTLWTNAMCTHERDAFISGLEAQFVNLRELALGVPPWTPLHIKLQRVTRLALDIPRDYTFSANESGCHFECPALTHLTLDNVSDVSFVTDTFFNGLAQCPLRCVSLSTTGDISPRVPSTELYPDVEKLSIRLLANPWTSRVVTKLAMLVATFPRLRSLDIVDESRDAVRGSIVDAIGQLPPTLERLRIVGLSEGRHSGHCEWIFPALRTLELRSCQIGHMLPSFFAPSLQSICLEGSVIAEEAVHHLLASTPKPQLQALYLSNSNVTSLPAELACCCPMLAVVALDGCSVGARLATDLAQTPQIKRIVLSAASALLPTRLRNSSRHFKLI